MPNLTDVIKTVRVRIGDYDISGQRYDDNFLVELVDLAINTPPLSDVLKSLFIDFDLLEFNREISSLEKSLIVIKTHLHYLYSLKTMTDRDNISITKGKLRIDNSHQSRDLQTSIEMVKNEFNHVFYYVFGVTGIRVE